MVFEFGDWELDTGLYELRRNGVARKVEPQVFDLLHYLLRNRDRVVSRDEIVDEIWDGRIVTEATISTCMKAARQAVGDDGRKQDLIRTVHGRGFRFVGDVAEVDGEAASAPPPATADPGGPGAAADAPAPSPPVAPGADAAPGQPAAYPASRGAARPAHDRPVIAVLPFDNLSAEVEAYFADGLTEDIITNLSRFRDLRVISRTSAFEFRKRDIGLAEFCAELHAAYVVEGSVRRAGGRVRIGAQLIDAASGHHLWADTYDREMEDIFALQDEVTRSIAANLGIKVQDVALQRALKKNAAELDAYDCVLRARRFTAILDEATHAEARDLLERAVALDPMNADAHALLGNIYLAEHRFGVNPQPDPIGRSMAMASRAAELDPQNAYARCWLAIVHYFRHENDKFEAEARRAIDLNPNDPEILADVGHFLAFMGEFERGVTLSRRARELNPIHPGWYYFSAVRYHYDRHEYEEALACLRRAGMPEFYFVQMFAAATLGQLGRREEAAAAAARAFELKPGLDPRAEFEKWNTAPDDLAHILDGMKNAGVDA